MITNPVAQVVQMYNLLEAHLRRAATTHTPIGIADLNKQGDIAAIVKSPYQVRDLLKSLVKKGFSIHSKTGYVWNLKAPPFVVSKRFNQRMRTDPSTPVVVAPQRRVKVAKDIELVIGDTLIVIGRNEKTNRLRIVIEDVGE